MEQSLDQIIDEHKEIGTIKTDIPDVDVLPPSVESYVAHAHKYGEIAAKAGDDEVYPLSSWIAPICKAQPSDRLPELLEAIEIFEAEIDTEDYPETGIGYDNWDRFKDNLDDIDDEMIAGNHLLHAVLANTIIHARLQDDVESIDIEAIEALQTYRHPCISADQLAVSSALGSTHPDFDQELLLDNPILYNNVGIWSSLPRPTDFQPLVLLCFLDFDMGLEAMRRFEDMRGYGEPDGKEDMKFDLFSFQETLRNWEEYGIRVAFTGDPQIDLTRCVQNYIDPVGEAKRERIKQLIKEHYLPEENGQYDGEPYK